MRVNITYSVELEKVQSEIRKFILECMESTMDLRATLEEASEATPLEAIEGLSEARTRLYGLDVRLEECIRVLGGYIDVKAQLMAQANSTPEEGDGEL